MESPETSAGPGAFEPRKPFEARIRLGIILAMVGTTLVGVSATLVRLTGRLLPLFNLGETSDAYKAFTFLHWPYLALNVLFIVGVFIFTMWPGPARQYALLVRIAAVGSVALSLAHQVVTAFVLENFDITVFLLTNGMVSVAFALSLFGALFFCAQIVKNRGDLSGAGTLKMLALLVLAFDIGTQVAYAVLNFLTLSNPAVFIAFDFLEMITLAMTFFIFLKTWKTLS